MQLLFDVEYCNSCWVVTVLVFLEARVKNLIYSFYVQILSATVCFQNLLKFILESFREFGMFQVSNSILRKPEFLDLEFFEGALM